MSHKFSRALLVLLLALMALPSLAQSTSPAAAPNKVELSGLVESIDGDLIIVQQQPVRVTGAEIKTNLEVGRLVKVEGLFVNGLIQAREVYLPRRARLGAEFVGVIEAVNADSIVVNGQTVQITPTTERTALVVGALVEVEARPEAAQNWVAREVNPYVASDDDDDSSDDNTTATPVPSVNVAFSAEQAMAAVLAIYPNTRILELELDDDGYWEIKTSHGLEVKISSSDGVILSIEDRDDSSDDSRDDSRDDDSSDDDNGSDDSVSGGSNDDRSGSGSGSSSDSGRGSDDKGSDDDSDDDDSDDDHGGDDDSDDDSDDD